MPLLKLVLIFAFFPISEILGNTQNLDYTPYILKKGETISSILYDKGLRPLFGHRQWVTKVLQLNRLNLESAKKLRTGEVIVLPVSMKYFLPEEVALNYIAKDEVSQRLAASVNASKFPRKSLFVRTQRHYLDALVEYSYGSGKVAAGGDVAFEQSYALSLSYRYQDYLDGKNWKINTGVKGRVQSRSGVEVEQNSKIGSTYAPNYRLQLFGEGFYAPNRISTQIIAEYERYSLFSHQQGVYGISEVLSPKAGVRIAYEYPLTQFSFDFGLEFMQGFGVTVANNKSNRNDFRMRADVGATYDLGYRFGVFTERHEYPINGHGENQFGIFGGILF